MAGNGFWNLGQWMQNLKKPAATATNPTTPTYATANDYTGQAASMLPTPAKVAGLQGRKAYQGAFQKTTVDPNEMANRWDVASTNINDQYMKRGGFYDRMVGDLNERGLAASGERNAQTATVGQNLATELAQARKSLEADRMNTQAGYDESYANRMGSMAQADAGIDQYNSGMGWQASTGRASLASQLADARNTLINQDYQNRLGSSQLDYQALNDMLSQLGQWGSQGDLSQESEDSIAELLGYPTPQNTDAEAAQEAALQNFINGRRGIGAGNPSWNAMADNFRIFREQGTKF